MDAHQFQEIKEVEDTHFWYKARREIIESILRKNNLLNDTFTVLEIGTANGANIAYFKKYFATMKGSEINEEALKNAKIKNPEIDIQHGWLPNNIGFNNEKFDVVFLFDVLEHVEDDNAALQEIAKMLKDTGYLVMTVPAYQFLFGEFDKFSHHFRRYNKHNLTTKVINAKYKIGFCSYFNCWLFPLVLVSRLVENVIRKTVKHGITEQSNSLINNLFYKIMRSEKKVLAKGIQLPFGSSLILVAHK